MISIGDVLKRKSFGIDNPALQTSFDQDTFSPESSKPLVQPPFVRETSRDSSNPPPPPPVKKCVVEEEPPPPPPIRVASMAFDDDDGHNKDNSK